MQRKQGYLHETAQQVITVLRNQGANKEAQDIEEATREVMTRITHMELSYQTVFNTTLHDTATTDINDRHSSVSQTSQRTTSSEVERRSLRRQIAEAQAEEKYRTEKEELAVEQKQLEARADQIRREAEIAKKASCITSSGRRNRRNEPRPAIAT